MAHKVVGKDRAKQTLIGKYGETRVKSAQRSRVLKGTVATVAALAAYGGFMYAMTRQK